MDIRNAEAVYPLSFVQEALFSENTDKQERGVGQCKVALRGQLDFTAFEKAWQQVCSRHSILRSFFVSKRLEKPLQVVHKELDFPVHRIAFSELSPPEQEDRLTNFLSEDRNRYFDPYEAPLIRATVCELSAAEHYLICAYHKLVLDEQSLRLLLQEVFVCYAELCQKTSSRVSPDHTYRNYLTWLKQQDITATESFWRSELEDFIAPTPLVVERTDSEEVSDETAEIKFSLAETSDLKTWSEQHGLSSTTLAAAAWALLLSRYSDEKDVVFGLHTSGRSCRLEGSEFIVGPFANTLPVRARVSPGMSTVEWLKEFETSRLAARNHEYVSLKQLRNWIGVPESLPVFESSLRIVTGLNDFPSGPFAGLTVGEPEILEPQETPLVLTALFGDELILRMSYDGNRFAQFVITGMLEQLQTLLRGFITHADQPVSQLPLLSEATLRQLLVDWNGVDDGEQYDQCLHQLFEAQVERTPNTLAVVFENQQLTYRELNQRANQLAHHLKSLGVGRSVLVGLCVERSPEMVIGILAVWKANGAYIPLDPSYPFPRLNSMLTTAKPPVLLSQERLMEDLPSYFGHVVLLDSDWPEIASARDDNPENLIKSSDLAYVIYTSGSTGEPKGVMVPHRGVCNSSSVYARVINMPPGSRMLQLTSIGFDMSIFDIVPALISGLTLCLAPQTPPLGADLFRILQEQKIQIISLPPSVLNTVPSTELPELSFIGVAGEAVSRELVARWSPGRRFYNAYGPAEGSIWVSGTFLDVNGPPVIGHPIANLKLYLVDSLMRLVPVGVPGELCIGGRLAVTWGYLRQPEVTADKFVPDPFSSEPGARLYRTGDLARFLPDGNLDFVGRTDSQVKIRGFRIELGEVEAILGRHQAIREVVVVVRQDVPGDNRLVAYVVPQQREALTTSELHAYLKKRLPENMVPSSFVTLDALPLSPNGKVDRRALPAPDTDRPRLHQSFIPPQTETEQVLAKIWADVLHVEKIGIHDNFFELGGHSLLATQVTSRVRDLLQVDLSLPTLFEAPTVAGASKLIEKARDNGVASAPQAPIAPVSREKRRMNEAALKAAR